MERIEFTKRIERMRTQTVHLAIRLPEWAIRIFAFERSFSTSLGTNIRRLCQLIASIITKEAERSKELVGKVLPNV